MSAVINAAAYALKGAYDLYNMSFDYVDFDELPAGRLSEEKTQAISDAYAPMLKELGLEIRVTTNKSADDTRVSAFGNLSSEADTAAVRLNVPQSVTADNRLDFECKVIKALGSLRTTSENFTWAGFRVVAFIFSIYIGYALTPTALSALQFVPGIALSILSNMGLDLFKELQGETFLNTHATREQLEHRTYQLRQKYENGVESFLEAAIQRAEKIHPAVKKAMTYISNQYISHLSWDAAVLRNAENAFEKRFSSVQTEKPQPKADEPAVNTPKPVAPQPTSVEFAGA
jgi:hypothetical protein